MSENFLKEIYDAGRYAFHESLPDWHAAIRACVEPLVRDGSVEESYAQSIIDAVYEYGPYICIAPEICMPHATNSGNVNRSAIGFMKCNEPVVFDDEENHQSTVFFVLAANNTDEHFANMEKLMALLEKDGMLESLRAVCSEADFLKLIERENGDADAG